MFDRLTLRPAAISDAFKFVDIMNSQYSRKKTPEYFYWQYIHPYEPTVLMCAFEANQMCGVFGLKKRKLNNGVIVGQAIDMLIIPAWRGKGLFRELADHALQHFSKELDILCVFANAIGNYAVQRSIGWYHIGTIKTLFLKITGSVSSGFSFDESLKNKSVRFYFERNQDYTRWRFDKNPEYSYKAVRVGDTIAWVKIFIDPITNTRYGDIVDIMIPYASSRRLYDIVYAACKYLQLQGAEFITTWAMPGTLLRSATESIGFAERNQERYFCIKVLNPEYEYLTEFSNWNLVQADAEIF
jgi:GNAT superfamily N-acetyltransferase